MYSKLYKAASIAAIIFAIDSPVSLAMAQEGVRASVDASRAFRELLSSRPLVKGEPATDGFFENATEFRSLLPGLLTERGFRIKPQITNGASLSGVSLTETEVNDDPANANAIALGDTISGVISAGNDIDVFALPMTGGTFIEMRIDARKFGSALDAILFVVSPDGMVSLAFNDDASISDRDSRMIFQVPADGTYFIVVTDFDLGLQDFGSPSHTYSLHSFEVFPTEQEPNDDQNSAPLIALTDTVFGFANPVTDRDFFSVDILDNTMLELNLQTVNIGSALIGAVRLWAPDGVTELGAVAGVFEAKLKSFIPTGGRFFVEIIPVGDFYGLGAANFFYTLSMSILQTGPGDPTALFATGLGRPGGMAATRDGRLFVLDLNGRVLEVTQSGVVSTFAQNLLGTTDLTIDGVGNILVPATIGTDARIWSFAPDGTQSIFTMDLNFPAAITVDRFGDVWAADPSTKKIYRFDWKGTLLDSVDASGVALPIRDLAFSPFDELHAVDGTSVVFRFVPGGGLDTVVVDQPFLESIAFDEDGFLYVANGLEATVTFYDPLYALQGDRFAITNIGGPLGVVFPRASNGDMSARVFVSNVGFGIAEPFAGGIVELNPSAIRAPGFMVGVDLIVLAETALDAAVVGAAYRDTILIEDGPSDAVWSIVDGALPPGLTLGSTNGVVSGVPEEDGMFEFTVRAVAGDRLGVEDFLIMSGTPTLSLNDAADGLLGVPGVLDSELEAFLDFQGNENGTYDLGDLRAFVVSGGGDPALLMDFLKSRSEARALK